MKILIKLVIVSICFSSCNSNIEQDCLICELQGDWIGNEDEEIMIIYQDKIVENQPWLGKYFEPFYIQKDKIVIDSIRFKKYEKIKKYKFGIRYKIEYLADDTLKLIKYGISDTTEKQELRLERLNYLYQYEFKKLSISSSPCLGGCPVFQLEIDSNGVVKYQGKISYNKQGNHRGKIKEEELSLLQAQVDKIDWKKLEKSYWEEITDIQYFNVEMEDKKGEQYAVTTNSPKSKSVNILIFRAFKIIENGELEKVDEELEFSTDMKYDWE